MIRRFDHVIVTVRDLESATTAYQALGFDARPGGRHPGRGTHNAIIRFGLDYLELYALTSREDVPDDDEGRATLRWFDTRDGGLFQFALAPDDIGALAGALEGTALDGGRPFAMDRLRPDGVRIGWRLLIPKAIEGRTAAPFFIQWDIPDDERLAVETPGDHPIGATGVDSVALAVQDVDVPRGWFEGLLGLRVTDERDIPELAARMMRLSVGDTAIELLAPTGPGPIQDELGDAGEGPYEVAIRVRSLAHAGRTLESHGTGVTLDSRGRMRIDPRATPGARIALVQG